MGARLDWLGAYLAGGAERVTAAKSIFVIKGALPSFQTALKLLPKDRPTAVMLARTAVELGDFDVLEPLLSGNSLTLKHSVSIFRIETDAQEVGGVGRKRAGYLH